MGELITINSYRSRIDAEVDKGFLESQGIKAEIESDDAGGMRQFPLSYKFGVELKVLKKDFNKAKKLLNSKKS